MKKTVLFQSVRNPSIRTRLIEGKHCGNQSAMQEGTVEVVEEVKEGAEEAEVEREEAA